MTELNTTQKQSWKPVLFLQAIVVIFTLSGVFGKLATQGHSFMSPAFLLFVGLDILVLAVYALFWQQALKRFDLHVAYANRASSVIWSLLWASIIFHETITVMNMIGTACILGGILLVNSDGN